MSEELERLVAEIPAELKRFVDADERTNKEVVEAALWREFGGEKMASIERRIEEKRTRINMLESERNERERELKEEQQELEALETKAEAIETKESQREQEIESALSELEGVAPDPEHEAVKAKAQKLGMEPNELAKRMPDTDNNNGEFRSL